MRVFPLFLAVLAAAIVYFAVIDRDTARTVLLQAGVIQPAEEVQAAEDVAEVATEEPAEAAPLFKVVAVKSVVQEIDSAVILRGQTEALREVEVRAETTGTVISEPLRKGTFVEEGDLLCRLDPGVRFATLAESRARLSEAEGRLAEARAKVPENEARLIEARARVSEAEVNQNAAARLSEDGFASETRVRSTEASLAAAEASVEAALSGFSAARAGITSAEAGIESARASIASAEREIERLELHAPFSGVLESDTAELGSLLQSGSLCSTIIQLNPIKLVAFVPETEVGRIAVSARAGARLAAGGGDVTGTVSFLSRSADPTTRTFRVEIDVANDDLRLRDGQTAEILIQADGARAHKLPASAMTLNADGALGVRTVDDNDIVRFVPVKLVRDTPDGVWLTGLAETAEVIVVGQEYVTEGTQVAVTYREEQGQ